MSNNTLPYADFSSWITRYFPFKVQKLSIDGGFTCPNRDGTVSRGGCSFCDNRTFAPSYLDRTDDATAGVGSARPVPTVAQQIAAGKAFFARKYPEMKYLAYFQVYSGTHAPLAHLKAVYEAALAQPDIVGIIIGTRPDCVDREKLEYIRQLSERTFVMVEYGIESVYDDVLRSVNRGHTFRPVPRRH